MDTQQTTDTMKHEKRFPNYASYARNWLIENEIKLKTVYVENGEYNPHFIYINRIANSNKNKADFRILINGVDKVKNCIMITFNIERHDRTFLCYYLKQYKNLLRQWSHGTCQSFINQNILAEVLSGAVQPNGKMNENVLY